MHHSEFGVKVGQKSYKRFLALFFTEFRIRLARSNFSHNKQRHHFRRIPWYLVSSSSTHVFGQVDILSGPYNRVLGPLLVVLDHDQRWN